VKRIVNVLAATALMVVLMATAVSPAFAVVPEQYGKNKEPGEKIGYGSDGDPHGCKYYADNGWHGGNCTRPA
jgi:hypothetical protein